MSDIDAGVAGGPSKPGDEPRITINGQAQPWRAESLLALLTRLGRAQQQGMAVALNDGVIPRSRWGEVGLSPGDSIEIVMAVQGG